MDALVDKTGSARWTVKTVADTISYAEEVGSCCGCVLENSASRRTVKKSGIRARPRADQ